MDGMTLTEAAGLVLVGAVLDWGAFLKCVRGQYGEEEGARVIAAVERLLVDARGVAAG